MGRAPWFEARFEQQCKFRSGAQESPGCPFRWEQGVSACGSGVALSNLATGGRCFANVREVCWLVSKRQFDSMNTWIRPHVSWSSREPQSPGCSPGSPGVGPVSAHTSLYCVGARCDWGGSISVSR